jgi:hypothetical protein
MWLELSLASSLLTSAGLAAAFVGSLYVWKRTDDKTRDHPEVIKRRVISIGTVCLVAPYVMLAWSSDKAPVHSNSLAHYHVHARGMLLCAPRSTIAVT